MKRKHLIALGLTLRLTFGFSATRVGSEVEAQSGPNAMPGPVHQQLAKRVGEYTTVTKFSIQPEASAVESTGTARFTAILDGRFLLEEDSGIFMGQQTRGTRIWGYDNATKQYESAWMYSGSTGIMRLTGSSNDGGKTVSFVAAS